MIRILKDNLFTKKISALMSRPNSRVQKISLEIVKGLIGFAIIILLMYWLVSSVF